MLAANPEAAVDRDTVNVIVAECFDGWLSDARALAVRPEHALEAIAAAAADEDGEGAIGAGTGTACFGTRPASAAPRGAPRRTWSAAWSARTTAPGATCTCWSAPSTSTRMP